jgi:hypothetical protein
LPPVPPECPPALLERIGDDVRAKVERRWTSPRRELGPCLVWRAGLPTLLDGTYGRMYDPTLKRSDAAHLVVWRRCFPDKPIPKGMTVDHACWVTLCQRPDHLQGPVTRAENTRRRHQRAGTAARTSETPQAVQRFAVALFAGVDRTTVEQKAMNLDELRQLLSKFEVLTDKRRGRCWSPTRYTGGASSRGNVGVESVSALVFDCDRVPPDTERLAGVYWLGHTTWSHTPLAPRWRVVIPLTAPVPATRWRDVWQRARAALCPEADPSCKDPGRQYWLPSHSGGVTARASCHDGPLLDPSTLPALPPETRSAELHRAPSVKALRKITGGDRRRGGAYMDGVIGKLETAAPGGRNDALNRAAWTLGRWVAAGALEQADVEDELYAAAVLNGLVGDDGDRQCWATIRSGLSAGLREPIDLDAEDRRR